MKQRLLIFMILLITSQLLSLVAFNGFNQRNHPELNWQSIQTTNCRIIYHDPLEKEAQEAASVAQNTFNTLAKTYQITPKRTCIIYISDQDNIPNGATVMTQYIFVWVNQNDYTGQFTGNDKWIRKVISHEMSHWFVACSTEAWIAKVMPFIPSVPHNINEGYAQYFSGEEWGYNRGDKTLKASILSQKTGIPSQQFDGYLLYADGFAKVRYLAAVYGEDKLIKLLKYRNNMKLYSFREAFEKVYHKGYGAFEEEWRRYIYTYYYGEVYQAKSAEADTSSAGNINDFTKLKTGFYQFMNMDWKGDKLLFAARKTESQKYLDLMQSQVAVDSLKKDKLVLNKTRYIFKSGNFTGLSQSSNGKWVTFAVYSRFKAGRLAPCVYRYDVAKQKLHRIGEGNKPVIDSTGGVYFQKLGKTGNDIQYYSVDNKMTIVTSIGNNEQIGNLALAQDEKMLAFTEFDSTKAFSINFLDIPERQVTDTIALDHMAQSIMWHSDHELIYTIENSIDYSLNVVLYNTTDHTRQEFDGQAYNSIPVNYTEERMYVLADYERGSQIPGYFKPVIKKQVNREFTENYYNKWVNIKPVYCIPDSAITTSTPVTYYFWQNIKWRAGFALPLYKYAAGGFLLSEALSKHIIGGFAAIPYSPKDKAWWMFMYENKTLAPTIDLMYVRQQWLSGVDQDRLYYQDIDKLSGKISFPINLALPFREVDLSFNANYTDVKNANGNHVFDNKGFASVGGMAGYAYNLPWKSSSLHKVRAYNIDYSLQAASKQMGMNMEFNQHSFDAGFAYAPLLYKTDNELIRTITVENRTNYEFVNGDFLRQYLPGVNKDYFIQSNNKPAFKQYYLRGYEERYLSKKILNIQNELNIKLMDDMDFDVLIGDLISVHYTGFSLWHDYTELHKIVSSDVKNRSFNALGYEFKLETNFMFIPTIFRMGEAFDTNFHHLDDYFMLEIPFLEMIQAQM